ncbi:OprD family outer membrane porin [Telluribacter humicola]|uniref:OprD family outer membrane porin n=1 Tax=Telluribacter humicola TaxID=1720261 RepID=UPI001A968238|nr:OprD family outer membrane porin [Telluribacter humicola]
MLNYLKIPLWAILLSFIDASVEAQVHSSQQFTHKAEIPDSTADLHHFFQRGHFHGHARSYWMGTDNKKGLSDAYAWGVGAGIGYQTPRIARHVELGLSGFFMFNVLSSDLSRPDPKTGLPNRYEVGLFNLKDPKDHEDLDRLEELYLRYHFGKRSKVTLGRQIPHSPFINPQDGRMRPTLTEGLALEWRELPNTVVQAEYLFRISPRSTVEWYGVGESMGLYPVGIDSKGNPSQYSGHTETKGVFQLGVSQKMGHLHVHIWDNYVGNVFNTAYAKAELTSPIRNGYQWHVGLQAGQQQALGNGGNPVPEKAYFPLNVNSLFFSGRISYKAPQGSIALNATRITAHGRYLMPREWGREPFYTFLPRERNEGMGDVTAGSINVFYTPSSHWKWELSSGIYSLPKQNNFRLNKYGMPSYRQLNLGMSYHFTGLLKGLDAQLLVVRKDRLRKADILYDRAVFNKVDMNHYNLIINYHY